VNPNDDRADRVRARNKRLVPIRPGAVPGVRAALSDGFVMSKFHAWITVSSLALIASPAFADEAADADGGAIVVSAMRVPIALDEVPASLTVLDKAAIDASQAQVVSDLLVRTPGVTLIRNGGYGTATGIRIRGADTDQTVVVIDGVRMNDPSSTGGGYNFANLMIGDTAQIEILRGPQSILWGSQAIGGVVNVVTATPERSLEGNIDVEAGSRETSSARAAIGGISGPVRWRLSGFSFSTDGISAISPRIGATERDGFHTRGGNGRVSIDLGGGALIDLRGYYSAGGVEIDSTTGDTPAFNETEERFGYAALIVPLFGGRLTNRFAYSGTRTDREGHDPRRARSLNLDSTGWAERFEYQGTAMLADGWQATFGAERENTRFRNFAAIPANPMAAIPAPLEADARLDSLYAQLSARVLPMLTLNAGIRQDDHDRFGGNTVIGGGGVASLFGGTTLLRASYGEGFKAPTLYQLGSQFGNAALDPERSKGWEAGAEQRLLDRKVTLSATYYRRKADNLIVFYSCSGPPQGLCLVPGSATTGRLGYYDNVVKTDTQGLELGGRADLGAFFFAANYSWIDAESRSPGPAFGRKLRRLPSHAANAEASYAFASGLTLGGAVRWSGKAFDDEANAVPLKAYTLVDLRLSYRISPELEFYGRAENLFDTYYETARNYNSLGRSIYAGFRGRF
jgi:vitamin B12 transporter